MPCVLPYCPSEYANRSVMFISVALRNGTPECTSGSYMSLGRITLSVAVLPLVVVTGVVANACAAVVFMRPRLRSAGNCFYAAISVLNICMLTAAILLYTVEATVQVTGSVRLQRVWVTYLNGVYCLSHVLQTSVVFTTVSAALVHLMNKGCKLALRYEHALIATASSILLATGLCASKYLELEVTLHEECEGLGRYTVEASKLAQDPKYTMIYSLYVSNIAIIWVPFGVLLITNVVIVQTLVSQHRKASLVLRMASRIHRRKSQVTRQLLEQRREAQVVLLIVLFVFLLCNTPSFLLTITENLDMQYLKARPALYGYARDMVNLMAILDAVANALLYPVFSRKFREELCNCAWRYNRSSQTLVSPKLSSQHTSAVMECTRIVTGPTRVVRFSDHPCIATYDPLVRVESHETIV